MSQVLACGGGMFRDELRPFYPGPVDDGTPEPGACDGAGLQDVDGVLAATVADRPDTYAWRVEPGTEQRRDPVTL